VNAILIKFILFSLSAKAEVFPHKSARHLMNIFYQNCGASTLPPYDFINDGELKGFTYKYNPLTKGKVSEVADGTAARSLNYLNCSRPQKAEGKFLCENPPSYLWGGKGFIDEAKKTVDLFHNTYEVEDQAHHPGLDCSGFINLTFLHAGLKVDRTFPYLKSTGEISAKEFMQPLSCFKEVSIEKNHSLKNGDVIAWNKHIVMVDTVSQDPFGLRKIKTAEDCALTKLNPQNADMIIINSKGANDPEELLETDFIKHSHSLQSPIYRMKEKQSGVGPGITRLALAQLAYAAPVEIMDLIQTACLAKFGISISSRKIKVVRHLLAEKNPSAEDRAACSLTGNEQVVFVGDNLNCKKE
jgi:hypothetical protein